MMHMCTCTINIVLQIWSEVSYDTVEVHCCIAAKLIGEEITGADCGRDTFKCKIITRRFDPKILISCIQHIGEM